MRAGRPGLQCRELAGRPTRHGTPFRKLGGPVFRSAANYRSGSAQVLLPLANWKARPSEVPQITGPARHNCCSFSQIGQPGLQTYGNYRSGSPDFALPLANWAARSSEVPQITGPARHNCCSLAQTGQHGLQKYCKLLVRLTWPGTPSRELSRPTLRSKVFPRGREATFLPETVIRIEGVSENRRAAAAWARTTEQPLVDRAPPGALNHQNLNV